MNNVEYVVVGGYAQAYHGRPRFTGDIEVLVRPSAENAARLQSALSQFGFGGLGLRDQDFIREGQVIQPGVAPNRIDILTSLTGCNFGDVWTSRIPGKISDLPVNFISKEQYIRNKRAVGRPQDLADLEALS
ncbi:MAG TPA: hypothetical protein VNX70_11450 [Bryobacteraceae bacterium]|nr:hypothetical protein [Bryobacteraceae bacterium]